MEIVIIGCTHAGTAAAINASKLYPNSNITVYERNNNISFLSCGIALYVEGIVKDVNGLFYSSPEKLQELGIKVNMQHNVTYVDIDKKIINVTNMQTKEEDTKKYDKLIVTTGSIPICPSLPGNNLKNILFCKNFNHAKQIIETTKHVTNVAIIGAGYIGVELVEAFEQNGKNVVLVDIEENILNKYLDHELSSIAKNEYEGKNITLALGETLKSFEGNNEVKKIITDKNTYDVELVIMCVGFIPNTELFKEKVDMLTNGAIIVDKYMRTSNKDIFAAGDCCAVYYNPSESYKYIPLATNAIRMGTLAAKNLINPVMEHMGTQGSSGIKVYNQYMATTGLTEKEAKCFFNNVKTCLVKDNYKPEFMPTYTEVTLKLVYDGNTRVLLGAQLTSTHDYTQAINTLSICIQNKMTIDQIGLVDQFFQPHFNKPWNLINSAALSAN